MAGLSVKSSLKTQSIKLNYITEATKKIFIETLTVCFAFSAHQEVILNAEEKYIVKKKRKKKKFFKFFPYRKPNDHPLYINNQSNHPPSIRKQLPEMINDRISKLSHNQDSFDQASPLYTEALKNSGYKASMKYNKAVSVESKND